jgi:hypothetical protein
MCHLIDPPQQLLHPTVLGRVVAHHLRRAASATRRGF